MNQRLAPPLAVNRWAILARHISRPNALDLHLYLADQVMSTIRLVHNAGDRCDVSINIAQRVRSQTEELSAGFKNLCNRFDLIWDRSDHQVGFHRTNLLGI